jgi:hypothetical protein
MGVPGLADGGMPFNGTEAAVAGSPKPVDGSDPSQLTGLVLGEIFDYAARLVLSGSESAEVPLPGRSLQLPCLSQACKLTGPVPGRMVPRSVQAGDAEIAGHYLRPLYALRRALQCDRGASIPLSSSRRCPTSLPYTFLQGVDKH